ncbi:g2770 [Coccomyxa elongata]
MFRRFRDQTEPSNEGGGAVDTESWEDRDAKVEVTRPEGFMMKVALQAKVDLPPGAVYEILTAPDNAAVFRGIKKVGYRKVLEDDGKGKQKVEVEQVAAWKLLMFKGSFSTRLFVSQDKRRGIVEFRLARPGLMKDFAGTWRVQPFTQLALSEAPQLQAQSNNPWHSLTNTLSSYMGDRSSTATLVTLEQSLEPAVRPPKPLEGLVKSIAVTQLQGLLTDLRAEVPRVKAGRPSCASLQPWEQRGGSRHTRAEHLSSSRGSEDDDEDEEEASWGSGLFWRRGGSRRRSSIPMASVGDCMVTLAAAPDPRQLPGSQMMRGTRAGTCGPLTAGGVPLQAVRSRGSRSCGWRRT